MAHYRHRGPRDRARPLVLQAAAAPVWESGPVRTRGWAPRRVAVMAHYRRSPEVTRSVVTMLRDLDSAGYETVLVSATDAADATDAPLQRSCSWAPGQPRLPESTTVVTRANLGHDFGSWAAALAMWPRLTDAERVLLVNDSVLGPLAPLEPVLADLDAGPQPVWGLLRSDQHRPHLQSFFVGYRDGVLAEPALRDFWGSVRVERSKARVVRYYELGLAEVLDRAGIAWRAMVEPPDATTANPSLTEADALVRRGLPFVKANVPGLAEPPLRAVVAGWVPPAPNATADTGTSLGRSATSQVPLMSPAGPLQSLRATVAIEGPWGTANRALAVLRRDLAQRARARLGRASGRGTVR